MWKYTLEVDGMMCGMCEAHANDAVRRTFDDVKKVTSSHTKGQTEIITENELDEAKLRAAFKELGYDTGALKKEPYEKKKKFFGLF